MNLDPGPLTHDWIKWQCTHQNELKISHIFSHFFLFKLKRTFTLFVFLSSIRHPLNVIQDDIFHFVSLCFMLFKS
uniref:Putative ovule protein n=1 Tax=Solanum chacoense TaxID=4108 RepID=A0A0V0HAH2_SOLCH